jgi:hypothetical protein
LAYDGFDAQLTTAVINNNGNTLTSTGLTIPAFDSVIKATRNQGNTKVDAIYLSYGLQTLVNQIISGQARYFVQPDGGRGTTLAAGDNVVSYMSPLGSVPIIGDFFCNPTLPYPYNASGSSGVSGGPTSDVYFLRHDSLGNEMVDLMPIGRTELARVILASINFAVSVKAKLKSMLIPRQSFNFLY